MKELWNEQLFDQLKEMVYLVDSTNYSLVAANQSIKERFPEYQSGVKCYALLFGREKPCEVCGIPKTRGGRSVTIQKEIQPGTMIEVEFQPCCEEGREHLCICTASDLPSGVESSRTVVDVLNGLHAAAYAINPETYRVTFVNHYLEQMLPEMRRGVICYQALMGRTNPCPNCPFPYLKEPGDTHNMEVYLEKLGKYFNIDAVYVAQEDHQNSVIFTGYDVTKRVENEQHLHKMAYLDMLLNLKNQLAFIHDVDSRANVHEPCFIYMVRLRNFSNFNLVMGRKVGDEFLQDLADYYCMVYGNRNKMYRIGGVKFVFIAESGEEQKKIQYLAEHPISQELKEKNLLFQPDIEFIGIEVPRFAQKAEQIIHNLEYVLSKNVGEPKQKIRYFQEHDIVEMERKNKIVTLVKSDVYTSGFQVYYQPIFAIQDHKFSKSEALLRLYDEDLGWISPAEFIPIAEANGTIGNLGKFVLDEVGKTLAQRMERGDPPVQINVNVSPVQFLAENFYQTIEETLQKYQIPPYLLHLEITESMMLNSFDFVTRVMRKIINLGVDFSIDDFGTGYSSLSYLGTLPIRGIKLDRSFLKHIVHSDIHMMIVNNVMKFAKDLGFYLVAEGVEEVEQYEILKRMGCDYIQGYFFSKPLPADEFERFMIQHYAYELY